MCWKSKLIFLFKNFDTCFPLLFARFAKLWEVGPSLCGEEDLIFDGVREFALAVAADQKHTSDGLGLRLLGLLRLHNPSIVTGRQIAARSRCIEGLRFHAHVAGPASA